LRKYRIEKNNARIQHPSATGSLPARNSSGLVGYFSRGTPPTTLPTNVTADFLNGLQEGIVGVIEGGGSTLILTDNSPLYKSTLALSNRKAGLFNAVLNGNFDLWQRGPGPRTGITTVPATGINAGGFDADRFTFQIDTHGTWSVARDTDCSEH
jgi:hypothetical protein